ncbi:MAG: hypothetical protein ISP49_06605 [Reyranella sp.]|nr:hypothetical protein [Reyranella sp.]MBL6651244.1 hypothetical protein [Reyranella sp.]
MLRFFVRAIAILGSLSGTLLLWMGQIGPDDAVSNYAKWAKKLGIEPPPEWLVNPRVDAWGIAAGAALLLSGLVAAILWYRGAPDRHRAPPPSNHATLPSDASLPPTSRATGTFVGTKVAGGSGESGPGGHAEISSTGDLVVIGGEIRGGDGGPGGPGGNATARAGDAPPQKFRGQRTVLPDLALVEFVNKRDASDADGHLVFVATLFAKLEQKAVLSEISVWGRKDCPRGLKVAPVTPIPASHWESAHIDVVEYLEAPPTGGRTRPTDAGSTYYSDLYLNRTQADEIFPPSASTPNWINMRDAFIQICNLKGLSDETDPTADRRVDLWPQIRQKARDGEILVRGRPMAAGRFDDSAPSEDIPRVHWRDFDFEPTRYMPDVDDNDVRFGQTIRQNTNSNYVNFDRYCDLHVNSSAIAHIEWKA